MLFHDRRNAGILLANKISNIPIDKNNTIVIALPKGGVPVGFEVAKKLKLPLNIILVKKISSPTFPEVSLGAVSEDNETFYNDDLIERLGFEISDLAPFKNQAMKDLIKSSTILRREFPALPLTGKNIILVDDGIATGTTIEVVVQLLKKKKVNKIMIATPVSSPEAMVKLGRMVDMIEVIMTPPELGSIGEWYEDFAPIEMEEVIDLLSESSCFQDSVISEDIKIRDVNMFLNGSVYLSDEIKSWVIFVNDGSLTHKASSTVEVAKTFANAGHAALLFELLKNDDDFYSPQVNIAQLSKRLFLATKWLMKSKFYKNGTPIAYFGANIGTPIIFNVLSQMSEELPIYAMASWEGHAEMIDKKILQSIYIPVLLMVLEEDLELNEQNKIAAEFLPNCRVWLTSKEDMVAKKFELENEISKCALNWFDDHLSSRQDFVTV